MSQTRQNVFFQGTVSAAVSLARPYNRAVVVFVIGTGSSSRTFQTSVVEHPGVRSLLSRGKCKRGFVAVLLHKESNAEVSFRSETKEDSYPRVHFLTPLGDAIEVLRGVIHTQDVIKRLRALLTLRAGTRLDDDDDDETQRADDSQSTSSESDVKQHDSIQLTASMKLNDPRLSTAQKKKLLQLKLQQKRASSAAASASTPTPTSASSSGFTPSSSIPMAPVTNSVVRELADVKVHQSSQHLRQRSNATTTAKTSNKKSKKKPSRKGNRKMRGALMDFDAVDDREITTSSVSDGTTLAGDQKRSIAKPTMTRIVVRMPNGQLLPAAEFGVHETLAHVAEHVVVHRPHFASTPFVLSRAYPRMRFGALHYTTSLESLELVPAFNLTLDTVIRDDEKPIIVADCLAHNNQKEQLSASSLSQSNPCVRFFSFIWAIVASLSPFGSHTSSTTTVANSSISGVSDRPTFRHAPNLPAAAPTRRNGKNDTDGALAPATTTAATTTDGKGYNSYDNGNSTMFGGGDGDDDMQ
jgi:UBX domain